MKRKLSITTVATGQYLVLVPFFIKSVREWSSEITIYLFVNPTEVELAVKFLKLSKCEHNVICVGVPPLPYLPDDLAIQGCARKLLVWDFLPPIFTHSIFIDVDTVVVGNLFEELENVLNISDQLLLARDCYVGFKEKMGDEFAPLEREWRPHFDKNNVRKYCNTGLIVSRREDSVFFQEVLAEWSKFIELTGKSPSIWDQNIFNYCLDVGSFSKCWKDVFILDERFNALKEYEIFVDLDSSMISLAGEPVLLMHFNGGDLLTKIARRAKTIQLFVS